ncbi:PucR family transcriptional regulator [Janibacter cremeus]|uniref:DNA-binding PucR family transcriptional regulator n=1 Tax=Janibacter cremeus TaxID=1285192 RepID=A0A852VNB8_9MICO|nr:helix-turn-helix domain-containing protein [Janibacter cremeus]NYF96950.1 DNA-binding PucR family transcriptional regulator [Janibacter cremeus]
MAFSSVPDGFTAWLQDFASAAQQPDQIDEFVATVDSAIIGAIPEIAQDRTLVEELHASTRAHWNAFLVTIVQDYRLELPQEAINLSLSIARRHHDIGVLLKVYRVANKAVFDVLAERTKEGPLPEGLGRDEVLISVWLRAEQWIDDSVEELIDSFTAERASLLEGDRTRRIEVVDALLAGAAPSPETEQVLGHALTAWQTAFVLSASAQERPAQPLHEVAARMCLALGLPTAFTTLPGSRELWGWVSTVAEPDLDLTALEELMSTTRTRVAIGRPSHGPTGFRTSHLQAAAAHRASWNSTTRCNDYRDIELVSLLGEGDLTREMVRRVALPLLGPRKGEQALRETVLTWLRCRCNADAAGAALFVHPNTVRYRLSRAQDLLGRPLSEDATALELALQWVELHGAQALDDPG